MKAPKLPMVQIVLMLIFLIGGSVLVSLKDLPRNFFGVDAAVFVLNFFGYFYIIAASIYYAIKGK